MSAAYSASLISNLATSSKNLPFNNIEEFAEQRTWKLIVLKDSADFDLYAVKIKYIILNENKR